jgi:DNA ligase-1
MDYSILAEYYEKLENTSSKLSKSNILAELLSKTDTEILPKVTLLVQGLVYPTYTQMELGIAAQMMIRAISKATGLSITQVEDQFKKTGDLGLAVEECLKKRKQVILLKKKLTVDFVFDSLRKLPNITGEGSQERKLNQISELLVSAKPKEARYIVRTILGELRVGAAEGIIRDSIVEAFLIKKEASKEEKENATESVEYAWSVLSDFSEVARIAKEKGISGLKKVKIELGKPLQVMLGLAAENIETVVKDFGKVMAEYKYDGARITIHKKGDKFWLFTRRQENVTKQFPDIVEFCKKGLKTDDCIAEGEALQIDLKTNYPIPFQQLSQRLHRKYDIEKMVKEIPVQVNLFDIIYLNGKMISDKPLKERREILEKIVKPIPGKFQLSKKIVTDDVKQLKKFYQEALNAKQEGLMLKVLNSPYTFGRHVNTMYKIKAIMETLDLVIVAAQRGEGGRSRWLTSYVLACMDSDTGNLLECGMMSTGLTEKEYEEMTKKLKSIITREEGRMVFVKPKIIVEVGYQEIQKSPTYSSGYALRFPRFIRERTDEKLEPDTIDRLESLFKSQGRTG